MAGIIQRVGFLQQCVENRPRQSDATGELVENTLAVDVSYPGASDVLHATTRHPHLQRESKRFTVTWTDVLRTHSHVGACSVQVSDTVLKAGNWEIRGHRGREDVCDGKYRYKNTNVDWKIRDGMMRKRDERELSSRKYNHHGGRANR